jgi:uncharacterized DUF497 family protein
MQVDPRPELFEVAVRSPRHSFAIHTYGYKYGVWEAGGIMGAFGFEWDDGKNAANVAKHGVSFFEAQLAFADPRRVIARDLAHSKTEERYYCFGDVQGGVLTVRFTY